MYTFSEHSPELHLHLLNSQLRQWRRPVVKYGGQGQSGVSFNDFQALNNPGSWQPVGASKN